MRIRLIFIVSLIIFINFNIYCELKWDKFGYLSTARRGVELQAISDHEVLVMGGYIQYGLAVNVCEIIDLNTKTIKVTDSLSMPKGSFTSHLTKDSNVVIIGGWNYEEGGFTYSNVELYDRKIHKWKNIGNLKIPRAEHSSIMLNDSLIVIVGGFTVEYDACYGSKSCEIFNINTGKSNYVNDFPNYIKYHTISILENQDIVLYDGLSSIDKYNQGPGNNFIYIFNRKFNSWSVLRQMKDSVNIFVGLKLFDGKQLLTGGRYFSTLIKCSKSISFLNSTNQEEFAQINEDKMHYGIAQLNEDIVVIAGGVWSKEINKTEYINLKNRITEPGPDMFNARSHLKMISMPIPGSLNRRILAIGGNLSKYVNSSLIEILQETTSDLPKITDIKRNCNRFYAKLSDNYGINSIELEKNESKNVRLTIVNSQQTENSEIYIDLIDNNKIGYFTLKIVNKQNLIIHYKDSINSFGYDASFVNNLVVNERSFIKSDTLVLTSNNNNYRGSIWLTKKINIIDGFSTKFSFSYAYGDNLNSNDGSEPGGDGFAFLIQNSSLKSIGGIGGSLGYDGISNGIAFEFDTFRNDSNQIENFNDKNGNHFAIQYSKDKISSSHLSSNNLFENINIPILYNDAIYNIYIDYNIVPTTLRIYLDSAGINNKLIAYIPNFKFSDYMILDNSKYSYIGFTSGTGISIATHKIFNWELCSTNEILNIDDKIVPYPLISPNPASDYIEINVGGRLDLPLLESLEIFNIFGEKISTPSLLRNAAPQEGNIKIDISNLSTGVYFIKIGDKFEKFVKM